MTDKYFFDTLQPQFHAERLAAIKGVIESLLARKEFIQDAEEANKVIAFEHFEERISKYLIEYGTSFFAPTIADGQAPQPAPSSRSGPLSVDQTLSVVSSFNSKGSKQKPAGVLANGALSAFMMLVGQLHKRVTLLWNLLSHCFNVGLEALAAEDLDRGAGPRRRVFHPRQCSHGKRGHSRHGELVAAERAMFWTVKSRP